VRVVTSDGRATPLAQRLERVALGAAGVIVLLLGFFPISAWLPGGLTDVGYVSRWREWCLGLLICAGGGVVSAILLRRYPAGRLLDGGRQVAAALDKVPARTDTLLGLLCGGAYVAVAWTVFDARPLLIDEIVQVLQARLYATGRLTWPVSVAPEFFSVLHIVDTGPHVYSQFPPGWAAMLSLGSRFGAEWIVGPVCGAVAVTVFARILRATFGREASLTVMAGSLLFGLSPFLVFQFASHMSHGPVLMWILLATLALASVLRPHQMTRSGMALGFVSGLCAGIAFAVRPLDAVAYAVPATGFLAYAARREVATRYAFLAAVVGLAIPVTLVCWVNVHTTGSPTLFGYEVLWGSSHGLGFHQAPWGDAHTPTRGVELLSLYFTRLNTYLFEAPFPSLLPVVGGLFMARGLTRIEQLLMSGTVVHAALYFAYWHDGFYLGPRFVVPWVPVLIILCLRFVRGLRDRRFPVELRAAVPGIMAAALVLTVGTDLPTRIAQYKSGLSSMRTDYSAAARSAGVEGALVFVRESWGAQLVARLWALGVSRPAAAALYSHVDACLLEHGITELERRNVRGGFAERALQPMLADSAKVRATDVSPDTTERMLPGLVYDNECSSHVMADREGYALYPPFLLDNVSGNLYARDFGLRDSVLQRMFPGRASYRVSRAGVDGMAPLVWTQLQSPMR